MVPVEAGPRGRGGTLERCGVGLSRGVRSPAKVTPRNMGNGADCLGNAWLLVWALVVNGHNSGEYVPCIYCWEVKEDLLLFKAWKTFWRDSGLQNHDIYHDLSRL